jgi:hypothetical protein
MINELEAASPPFSFAPRFLREARNATTSWKDPDIRGINTVFIGTNVNDTITNTDRPSVAITIHGRAATWGTQGRITCIKAESQTMTSQQTGPCVAATPEETFAMPS